MTFKLKLRRTGNSVGLVLPKEALDHLGAGAGDPVLVSFVADGGLRITTADPEFEGKVQAAEELNRKYGNGIRALIRRSL